MATNPEERVVTELLDSIGITITDSFEIFSMLHNSEQTQGLLDVVWDQLTHLR